MSHRLGYFDMGASKSCSMYSSIQEFLVPSLIESILLIIYGMVQRNIIRYLCLSSPDECCIRGGNIMIFFWPFESGLNLKSVDPCSYIILYSYSIFAVCAWYCCIFVFYFNAILTLNYSYKNMNLYHRSYNWRDLMCQSRKLGVVWCGVVGGCLFLRHQLSLCCRSCFGLRPYWFITLKLL